MATQQQSEPDMKQYLITLGSLGRGTPSETFMIEIPSTWKVTYGPMLPGSGGNQTLCLRIYETDKMQRAIFQNVVSFRDLSLKILRRSVRGEPDGSETVFWEADQPLLTPEADGKSAQQYPF